MTGTAKRLTREGKAHAALWYRPDTCMNPKRVFWLLAHGYNQFGKFKKYYGKEK